MNYITEQKIACVAHDIANAKVSTQYPFSLYNHKIFLSKLLCIQQHSSCVAMQETMYSKVQATCYNLFMASKKACMCSRSPNLLVNLASQLQKIWIKWKILKVTSYLDNLHMATYLYYSVYKHGVSFASKFSIRICT